MATERIVDRQDEMKEEQQRPVRWLGATQATEEPYDKEVLIRAAWNGTRILVQRGRMVKPGRRPPG